VSVRGPILQVFLLHFVSILLTTRNAMLDSGWIQAAMKQNTGQHILSVLLSKPFNYLPGYLDRIGSTSMSLLEMWDGPFYLMSMF
jgi:hypothetical protein